MIELTTLIDLGKVFLEAANEYKKTRQVKHGITPDPLIELHESLYKFKLATETWRDEKRCPTLSTASDEIRNRWYKALERALTALNNIDIATVRVYSPELAEWMGENLLTSEATCLESQMPSIPNADQLLKMRKEIDRVTQRWFENSFVPMFIGEEVDGLSDLAKVLDESIAKLGVFINQNWKVGGQK